MVPGIAWIAGRRPLPMLRWAAAAVVVLVILRIGWEPRIVGSDVGTTPIFNWLLYGYGVPAAAFWPGGQLLRRRRDDVPSPDGDRLGVDLGPAECGARSLQSGRQAVSDRQAVPYFPVRGKEGACQRGERKSKSR